MKSKKLLILLTPAALAIPMMAASCDFGSKKSSGPILVSTTGSDGISSGGSSSSNGNTNSNSSANSSSNSGSAGSSNGSGSSANGNSANINPGSTNTNERPSNDSPSSQPPVNPPSAPVNNGPTLGMSPEANFSFVFMERNIQSLAPRANKLPADLKAKYDEALQKLRDFKRKPATKEALKEFKEFEKTFYTLMSELNKALQTISANADSSSYASVEEIRNAWIEAIKHLKDEPLIKNPTPEDPNNVIVPTATVTYPEGKVVRNQEAFAAVQEFMKDDLTNYPFLSIASNGRWIFKNGLPGEIGTTIFQKNDLDAAGLAKREWAKEFILSQFYDGMPTLEKAYVIMKFVTENLNYSDKKGKFLETAYIDHYGVCKEYVDMMMWLLSAAHIPYKVGTGDAHIFLAYQLEDKTWVYADPTFVDTGNSTTGENSVDQIIGQPSTPELDGSAAFNTYRTTQSVELDDRPGEKTGWSWSYFPYDLDIPKDKVITKQFFDSHFMNTIWELASRESNYSRLSAFQYYHGNFYYIWKENDSSPFKIKILNAKNNTTTDLNVTGLTIAKPLLNEYNGKLFFLKNDTTVMKLDLTNGNQISEFYKSNVPIKTMNLLRDTKDAKLIINGADATTKIEKLINS
ncbi:transglutaminase domain-containing protein [Mycoplasma struthionis]|uniref:Transglutaminase domain-containing protein n=1 Tax=Mycoplasma struthionis TaxID=538220 RepID=A0A3G8LJ22_9MOLU|nr:transglutaminase domain-containing protein [Mycoplasma struthionis]AZG68658.1 transglutaminase domain-containing protein [Mycoplasma struthionis]